MDEGSRGQFLNLDRTLINIQKEIEDHSRILIFVNTRLGAPCPNTKSFGIENAFRISYSGGEKTHFSFYIGGSYCEA